MDLAVFLVPFGSALLGAISGGVVVHFFTKSRDALNQRRSLRVQYLIDAYRRLEDSSDRSVVTPDQVRGAELAVSDILLLGHRREVEIAEQVLAEVADKGGGSILPLTEALRSSLRAELKLENVQSKLTHLRWTPTNSEVPIPEHGNGAPTERAGTTTPLPDRRRRWAPKKK